MSQKWRPHQGGQLWNYHVGPWHTYRFRSILNHKHARDPALLRGESRPGSQSTAVLFCKDTSRKNERRERVKGSFICQKQPDEAKWQLSPRKEWSVCFIVCWLRYRIHHERRNTRLHSIYGSFVLAGPPSFCSQPAFASVGEGPLEDICDLPNRSF